MNGIKMKSSCFHFIIFIHFRFLHKCRWHSSEQELKEYSPPRGKLSWVSCVYITMPSWTRTMWLKRESRIESVCGNSHVRSSAVLLMWSTPVARRGLDSAVYQKTLQSGHKFLRRSCDWFMIHCGGELHSSSSSSSSSRWPLTEQMSVFVLDGAAVGTKQTALLQFSATLKKKNSGESIICGDWSQMWSFSSTTSDWSAVFVRIISTLQTRSRQEHLKSVSYPFFMYILYLRTFKTHHCVAMVTAAA